MLGESFDDKVSRLEERIDSRLKDLKLNDSPSGGTLTMNVSLIEGLRYNYFNALRIRYIDAGWLDVKWHTDQRDGDYIEFIAW